MAEAAAQARSFVAVGTFKQGIEIWDLDVLDPLEPAATLGGERELTDALGVSRTTVTRAYAQLRESGYAVARQGAGTFTRVPGGRARTRDRALTPDQRAVDHPDGIDVLRGLGRGVLGGLGGRRGSASLASLALF